MTYPKLISFTELDIASLALVVCEAFLSIILQKNMAYFVNCTRRLPRCGE